jgi:hypothetical protein
MGAAFKLVLGPCTTKPQQEINQTISRTNNTMYWVNVEINKCTEVLRSTSGWKGMEVEGS